jgi:DMSO/TMAO reductase YedYZ heme-binding membrane subunit
MSAARQPIAAPPRLVVPPRVAPPRPPTATRAASAGGGRLSGGLLVAIGALAGILIVLATDQVLPGATDHQAQLRGWLAARAAGFMSLMLLTFQVVVGLILSHPTNKSTWRLSKLLFPWHEHAWVFTIAFGAVHVVAIVVDRFANVGLLGTFVPGLSEYRTWPVALGTISMYALLITGLTARVTRLLPSGWWLKLHRLSLVVLALAWAHGILSGTDTPAAAAVYGGTFAAVLAAATYRYWVVRSARPTFASSLPEGHR